MHHRFISQKKKRDEKKRQEEFLGKDSTGAQRYQQEWEEGYTAIGEGFTTSPAESPISKPLGMVQRR